MGIVLLVVKFLCSFTFSVVQLNDKEVKSQIFEKQKSLGYAVPIFLFACPGFISVSLGPPQVILIIGTDIACEAGDSIQLCLLCPCCSCWAPKERDYRIIATVTGQGSRNSEVCLMEGKIYHAYRGPKNYLL